MNDSNDEGILRLKQMLEEATAVDPSVTESADAAQEADLEPADGEAAALRKTWQSFEQLIVAADASLPETLNVLLEDRLKTYPTAPKTTLNALETPRHNRWIGPLAASAAALLIAVALGGWIIRNGLHGVSRQAAISVAPDADSQIVPRSSTVVPAAPPSVTKREPPKATSTPKTSPWDDPPETQIAFLSQQISNVQQNWLHRVDDVDLVQFRIDEMTDLLQSDAI